MTILFIFPFLFLLGGSFTAVFSKALEGLGPIRGEKEFKARKPLYLAIFRLKACFPKESWNALGYVLSFSRHLLRLLYAATFSLLLVQSSLFPPAWKLVAIVATVTGVSLVTGFFFLFLVSLFPLIMLRITAPLTSLFLLALAPLTFPLLSIQKKLFQRQKLRNGLPTRPLLKDKILELIHEARSTLSLSAMDQRLILSIASFRDRIAREIMVPRIDIFALPADRTLKDVARDLSSEGFSRIPIYRDKIDNMIGVLLYKDVIHVYYQSIETKDPSLLDTPVSALIKPLLYTPETKKISSLLQDFRQKKTHLAIVVDEYGGTEGLVTAEDILEELVGEIADEHDAAEEDKLYTPFPGGGWVIDGKMTILDIEKELNIALPTSSEYDTIGGLIFHRAGMIPSKGWKLHADHFDIEVMTSNERAIEKVIVTARGALSSDS